MIYHHQTDAVLFELFSRGDTNAFNGIYDRYFRPLINTAYQRVGCREEAQEIVQDLFVGLYLKRKQVQHTANLSGYLHTSLRNKIIDKYREELTRQKHHDLLKQYYGSATGDMPDKEIDKKILQATIANIVRQLPEKCRQVFVMSRMEYLSHQAIAKELTISVSTVEKHIVKALKIMRTQMKSMIND